MIVGKWNDIFHYELLGSINSRFVLCVCMIHLQATSCVFPSLALSAAPHPRTATFRKFPVAAYKETTVFSKQWHVSSQLRSWHSSCSYPPVAFPAATYNSLAAVADAVVECSTSASTTFIIFVTATPHPHTQLPSYGSLPLPTACNRVLTSSP